MNEENNKETTEENSNIKKENLEYAKQMELPPQDEESENPHKHKHTFLFYLTYPFRLLAYIFMSIGIWFLYDFCYTFIYTILIQGTIKFIKRNYKNIWNVFVLSMLVLNTIFTLRATERNRRSIEAQTIMMDNMAQTIENTNNTLKEYQAQCETLQQELNQYKDDQLAVQEETTQRINSLNKKVTSRSGEERKITPTTTNTVTQPKSELQEYAHNLVINQYGWTESDFTCLVNLWNKESGWNPNAHNSSSGAHGIPQSLPASKMASEGSDYYTNGKTQIRWGLKYIAGRYGSPTNAWQHWQNKNWY